MSQWLAAAGIDVTTPWALATLMHFCYFNLPATKQMLPKLLALLNCCHTSGQRLSQWHFNLQQTILNNYRAEGNCLFFGDAKEILCGELNYGMEETDMNVERMQGLNLQ